MRARLACLMLLLAPVATAAPAWGQSEGQEGIRYRELQVSDFRASGPPYEVLHAAAGLTAASCLSIVPAPELSVELKEMPGSSVSAHVKSPFFVAVFDPKCSWWSAEVEDERYALLHEQIHFAIAETAARELTRDSQGSTVRAFGADRDQAVAQLRRKLEGAALQARHAASSKHVDFDRSTSRDSSHVAQSEWASRYASLIPGASAER